METYEEQIYPVELNRGVVVIVTERDRSLDNGRSWHTMKYVDVIEPAHAFPGSEITRISSESGFWGNCNEIRSGTIVKYCSIFDGRRWRSMRRNS